MIDIYKPKIRVSIKIENREKYLARLDIERQSEYSDLLQHLCEKFHVPNPKRYMLIKHPDQIVDDPKMIPDNSQLLLIRSRDYQAHKSKELRIWLDAFMLKKRVRKSYELKIIETEDALKQYQHKVPIKTLNCVENVLKSDFAKKNAVDSNLKNAEILHCTPELFFEHKKDKSHPIQLTTTYQRSSVRKICVPNQHVKHIAYRNIYINDIEIQTPDMEDFCTQTIHCENYEDLGETVRILCLMKGFNIIFPRGDKYETILYWCECYGDRKGVQSTKRTGCDFKLQYERTPDKKGYFLYKYQSSHNHPLEERNMYLGDYAFQKMKVISRELRKVALNPQNSVKMEKLKNDSVDPREDYNYDQEYEDFINGIKPVEDMRVLRSFNRCVYNRKHIRIDAACKTRAFQKYERDDIQDIDQEGIKSSQNMAGVYTNVKTYPFFPDSSNRHQTILHCAQEFELEILAKHYKRDLTEVILDLEEDSFEKYKLAQLSRKKDKIEPKIIEIPNKNLSNIEAKQKYMKLNQISHKVSPYCIYEVTSEWDDAQDGPPCDFLADTMPTYEIEGEYYIPSKTVTRKMKKEESVEEAENKEPETDSNISSIYDEKSDISLKSGSDAANDYSTRPRLSKDSIDIYADLDTEIMNDVQGIESNNTVIKKKSRQTKYDVSKEQDIKDEPEVRFFN